MCRRLWNAKAQARHRLESGLSEPLKAGNRRRVSSVAATGRWDLPLKSMPPTSREVEALEVEALEVEALVLFMSGTRLISLIGHAEYAG